MRESCISPDNFTFPLLNRAISSLQNHLRCGEMVHCIAIQMGFGRDLYFCNTLIEVYVKNYSICSARNVFDEMPNRDLVTWATLISGYVCSRNIVDSFRLFREMLIADFEPNSVTLMIMFRACSVSNNVIQGRELHGYVIKKGLESNLSVHNSILTMYSKTGNFEDAKILFEEIEERDVVSWNIMISAYSLEEDSYYRVAESFNKMRIEVNPGVETLTLVISVCAKSGNLLQGEKIHGYAIKTGLVDIVLQTSLVDLYAKCGEVGISARLFKELPQRNYITWSSMISGFIQNGYFMEAIELFQQMQTEDFEPGIEILRSLFLAYTNLGALRLGKGVHCFVLKNIIYSSEEEKTTIETSILNMYAKCGSIISAKRCFDRIVAKDVVAWSSMIDGYSGHGRGIEAIETFEQMQEEGVKPNSITFLSLLSACSHSGLVSEGCRIFSYMNSRFGVKPDLNHYTCMVDLLGRSGKLQEAVDIIEKMDVEPDSRIWGALFAASRVYSDNEIGVYAAQNLLELEPDNAGYRTLLSNLHASAERWDEAETVRRVMSEKYMKKKPGWSCIETREGFHGFVAGDGSHSHVREIYETLECLSRTIEEFGCNLLS
ncbi:Pentatricopeptide repeat [Macleaya cordata]|uniref:Pentatricopeptide repeat n=1 Tax=Macleaya cordata TaxID=56857 RepID=A0A200QRE1_MACCD|nr:Pentatricopeptide repeat [Macleaya cordata]